MKNLRTIILAAGKGIRMKSGVPKVLHPVCGKAMIEYVLDVSKAAGSSKNYVVLGHKSEDVQKFLDKDFVPVKQKKLLGTADAVKSAERYFKSYRGDVLVMCGDTPLLTRSTIRSIVRQQKRTKAACTFLTAVVHNPFGYGRIIRDEKGYVQSIREEKDAVGYEKDIAEINVGVYCFDSRELFKGLKEVKLNQKKKEFYLTDMIELFRQKELKIETIETETPQEGLGINTRADLAAADSEIRRRILKSLMLDGVTIVDPDTTYIDASAKIGQDTVIRPFTVIESDVRIGKNCSIGPFARIRPGSRISDHAEVGNYTEVSRSKVGRHTLMKHFSYLGDTVVGDKVNIGAGAVTANFDGMNKNVTKINDGAFIGCDAVLVAPVAVGKNAVVGAGAVLPKKKNVPEGALAKGVPAQIEKVRRKRK